MILIFFYNFVRTYKDLAKMTKNYFLLFWYPFFHAHEEKDIFYLNSMIANDRH